MATTKTSRCPTQTSASSPPDRGPRVRLCRSRPPPPTRCLGPATTSPLARATPNNERVKTSADAIVRRLGPWPRPQHQGPPAASRDRRQVFLMRDKLLRLNTWPQNKLCAFPEKPRKPTLCARLCKLLEFGAVRIRMWYLVIVYVKDLMHSSLSQKSPRLYGHLAITITLGQEDDCRQ